ncbi:MAG: DUF4197 family protein [Gammaproteobacteria bacterium]|nr:DUF4197 family protein [Gammaproteobacteria bacterium]
MYKELLDAYPAPNAATPAETPAAPTAPVAKPATDLEEYVTQQTVAGMFNALGAQENFIRNNLASMTGGVLRGREQPPAVK